MTRTGLVPAPSLPSGLLAPAQSEPGGSGEGAGVLDPHTGLPAVDDATRREVEEGEAFPAQLAEELSWLLLCTDPDAYVAEVAQTSPGPELAARLTVLSPEQLSPGARFTYLQAWHRQLAWTEAQAARALVSAVGDLPEPSRECAITEARRRSMLHEAALATGQSAGAIKARLDIAVDLEERLPGTAARLREGSISWQHARVMSETTMTLTPESAAQVEARVLPHADTLPLPRFRTRCRWAAQQVEPVAAEQRVAAAVRNRRIERFADGPHGCLQVWSDPRDIQAIWGSLTLLAGPRESDDPRTLGNRRVDALLGLCLAAVPDDSALPTGPTGPGEPGSLDSADCHVTPTAEEEDGTVVPVGPRAVRRVNPPLELQVVIDLASLAGLTDEPAFLPGHGAVPAGVVREWLSDVTTWRRLVTDPVTGHLLDYGPRRRFAPGRLRSFLIARDRHCIFPGCSVAAARCDSDHHPPWRADGTGGSTSAADMAQLCRQHHLWVTHGGWSLVHDPGGRHRFQSPTGWTYVTGRPHALGADSGPDVVREPPDRSGPRPQPTGPD